MQQARKKFKTNKIRMTESGDIFFLHDAEKLEISNLHPRKNIL